MEGPPGYAPPVAAGSFGRAGRDFRLFLPAAAGGRQGSMGHEETGPGGLTSEQAHSRILEITPEGQFLTYGLGVSLTQMRSPSAAQARVPVGTAARRHRSGHETG